MANISEGFYFLFFMNYAVTSEDIFLIYVKYIIPRFFYLIFFYQSQTI